MCIFGIAGFDFLFAVVCICLFILLTHFRDFYLLGDILERKRLGHSLQSTVLGAPPLLKLLLK